MLALLLTALLAARAADEPDLPPGARPFAIGMGAGRIVIGAAPIVAYEPSLKLLGFPPEHDNPSARVMAGLFGVRDIALGGLVLTSMQDAPTLRRTFLLNAAVDLGDAAVLAVPLIADQGIDAAAGRSLAMSLTGAALWTAGWVWLRDEE